MSNAEERWSRGCCGATPMPALRCLCCCFQADAAVISTQQSYQSPTNLHPGYSRDICLLLVLSQALCDMLCSPYL